MRCGMGKTHTAKNGCSSTAWRQISSLIGFNWRVTANNVDWQVEVTRVLFLFYGVGGGSTHYSLNLSRSLSLFVKRPKDSTEEWCSFIHAQRLFWVTEWGHPNQTHYFSSHSSKVEGPLSALSVMATTFQIRIKDCYSLDICMASHTVLLILPQSG